MLKMLDKRAFKNVLEVGGGLFPTLQHVCEMHNSLGVGVDPFINSHSREKYQFISGMFEDPMVNSLIPDHRYDLAIAADVLEHVVNTDLFVETLRKKMAKGSLLLLSVPNPRSLRFAYQIFIRGTFPRRDSGLFDKTHLRWFCKSDILELMQKNKFKFLKHGYSGRFIPDSCKSFSPLCMIALQNIFLFEKLG
jgi:hypothetical protein